MKRLILFALGAILVGVSFVYCSSQGGVQGLRSGIFSRSVDPNTTNNDDDDDDDDYRDCTDSDTCEQVCERIYDESWSDCNDLETDEVSDLQRVWKELRGNVDRNDLEDIDLDHFEEYLEIGVDGWLREIEGYGTVEPYTRTEAQAALEWLVETEQAARVLSESDEGDKVLKQLINRASRTSDTSTECSTGCLLSENDFPSNSNAVEGHVAIKWGHTDDANKTKAEADIDNCKGDGFLKLQYYDSGLKKDHFDFEIKFDRNLCLYRNLTAASLVDGKDIFTASADNDNDNEYLFDLAFKLLDDVCSNDLNSKTDNSAQKVACRKALMCALAINEELPNGNTNRGNAKSDIEDWPGWEFVNNKRDLGEDYDECTAGPDTATNGGDDDDAFDEDNLI